MVGIYKITNPNNRVYIGQSKVIEKRLYCYSNVKNCKNQIRLYRSLVKYGWKNHKFDVIEECLIEQLNERERYWQDYYDVLGEKGMNLILTKTDTKKGTISPEKIVPNRGKKLTLEVTKKMSEAQKGHSRKHKEETKILISQKCMGRVMSESTRNKISNSRKGYKASEKIKLSTSNNFSKKVIDTVTGKIFKSGVEAASFYNIKYRKLGIMLRDNKYPNKTNLKYYDEYKTAKT